MKRHTKHTRKAPPRPCRDSVTIQITTTRTLALDLDAVQQTGYFGTSRAAAAERLLAEAIRAVLTEGILQKRKKAFEKGTA
jgi:hypothetical protein